MIIAGALLYLVSMLMGSLRANNCQGPCMLQATSLASLAGVRHGFFTRAGGVSDGVYASLNGGIGSNDAPARVAENRARMAAVLGVGPERLITAYQVHSPDV